ncbi:hypothetical protein FHG87_022534, partial [Trinorchestia longiramus]
SSHSQGGLRVDSLTHLSACPAAPPHASTGGPSAHLTLYSLTYWHPYCLTYWHPYSLTYWYPYCLTYWHPYCLTYWHPYCLTHWYPYSLTYWYPYSLTYWHPYCLTHWYPYCLTHWYPYCLTYWHPYCLTHWALQLAPCNTYTAEQYNWCVAVMGAATDLMEMLQSMQCNCSRRTAADVPKT